GTLDIQSKASKQILKHTKVSHGLDNRCFSDNSSKRFCDYFRFDKSVSSRSCTSSRSKVPHVRFQGSVLPVHSPTIRAGDSASGIHHSFAPGHRLSKEERFPNGHLPR